MDYNKRIDDNFLKAEYVDGEVLQHTDMNELESVVKLGVNANYEDIQKIQDGTIPVENSNKLSGATLSKVSSETLQNSDIKIPTSAQVKQYVDSAISSIDLTGYASELFVENEISGVETRIDNTVAIYDSNGNGIVDNAEKVNNHIVLKDVPSDAEFTDTVYDDTEVRGLITDLSNNKVDKVTGKGLSTNDFTNAYKTKLDGIANNAQVNVLEKVSVNGTQQTISNKSVNISVPTKVSDLSNDSNFVKDTDYATAQKGGVVKANMAGFNISTSGIPSANVYNYTNYQNAGNTIFIGKGTLEAVIAGKGLVSNMDYSSLAGFTMPGLIKLSNNYGFFALDGEPYAGMLSYDQYLDAEPYAFVSVGTLGNVLEETIGDISTVLDTINGEVI